jgi:two-component system, OmpR family, sensor histidine kinase CiaH
MQPLFTRIRWRLVGWTMLILGLILVLLGATVYVALSRSLTSEVDRNLEISSQQALPALLGPPDQPGRANNRAPLGGRTGYRGGVFILHLAPDGQVLANPQEVNVAGVTWPDATTIRAPALATINLNDEPTRVLVQRAPDADLLIVGESLQPEQTALHFLVLVLVAGGGLGLLMVLGGAWFLSGRALVPIQQAFQRQQEFVADASHELRTPLTVLRSATDLLNQDRTEPLERNGELFDDVRAEIGRVQRLTQDLLTLARSDQGELELMTAPVELVALAGDVVRRTTPMAHTKAVQLELTGEENTPMVEADPERLQQVLLILLDNAIKHTPAGGRVDVRVQHHTPTHAVIQVEDTGSGIPAEHLPRIFDRFYRADRARSDGGTGLGLAIAKMLVEAHGGHLTLTSKPDVGTQVTVSLPTTMAAGSTGYEFPSSVLSQLQGWLSKVTY